MSIIFVILAFLCLGYYVYTVSYAGVSSSFLGFWLITAICLIVIAILWNYAKKTTLFVYIPGFVKIAAIFFVLICLTIFAVVEGLIISKMNSRPDANIDYLIVLGAQVRGERVTKSLAKRLDKAIEFLQDNPDTKVIVSGGQGEGEDLTEAEAMKRYLVAHGINEELVIKEEKSTSTKENLVFSYDMVEDKEKKLAIVTNNFHVYRALKLADKLGLENVEGLAAPSDNRLLVNYMVREFFALSKAKISGSL